MRKVHVIINPASGQPQPILNKLNNIFHPVDVDWDISITTKSGDASRFARSAIEDGADVVAAYGGDGTVMEVAHAVKGGNIPMAILPGGTANLMSVELGIPKDLEKAAEIIIAEKPVVRNVDMGKIGDGTFMLRVGIGFSGEKVKQADRALKDRWGILAYSIAALKAMKISQRTRYYVTIDGTEYETDGLSCLIDNAGNIGVQGLTPKGISVSDGLLDVIIVRDASVRSLIAVGTALTEKPPNPEAVKHWQGSKINIKVDSPQTVQVDGEIWEMESIDAEVLPGALPILTSGS